ncbi:calcium/sodium antiporter [Thioclava atlantica]|uniref:Na+/Ca+ antiporter n=1 Tax=Thioclava atlantica TaxID=1317124 RepID=A0A085TZC4_9RHOB|nr:calcium/sodium antiporter [Thioclava atlantica]KFE36071.1 Na+/Ca+ antiporter [Thioclava atlantica]
MIWDFGEIAVGLVLLVVAGDMLVKGAVALSLRLGIPALIVGLTVVAFGTSAPELMVSVAAVLDHAPSIALGNVVGSNIANILVVLGLPAVISAIRTDEHDTRESFVLMMGATIFFVLVAFMGPIRWPQALLLLGALAVILFRQVREALTHRANRDPDEEVADTDPEMPLWRLLLYIGAGLVGLPLGADLLVEGATAIARTMGVSDTVIGLTLVALGTSLPELATSITAAMRGRADVALGNVVGSNIFNLLCIIGVAGLFGPLPVPEQMLHFDLWVMLAASILLGPFIFGNRQIGRGVGIAFTLAYIAYIIALLFGGRV